MTAADGVIQPRTCTATGMDAPQVSAGRCRGMGVLPHIKKPDDALGHFFVQTNCRCGAAHSRAAGARALVRIIGGPRGRRQAHRCSKRGAKGAEVVAIAIPRIRGRGSRK